MTHLLGYSSLLQPSVRSISVMKRCVRSCVVRRMKMHSAAWTCSRATCWIVYVKLRVCVRRAGQQQTMVHHRVSCEVAVLALAFLLTPQVVEVQIAARLLFLLLLLRLHLALYPVPRH